jgi:hypothetical protein
LQAQILDIAFNTGAGKCRLKNVQHSLNGFAFRSTLRFTAISSFIQCYLFYVHQYESPPNHFFPVVFIISIHQIIAALRMKSCILRASICSQAEFSSRSMLFNLCSPDLRGGRSVLTRRLIIGFTYVACKHDGIIGRVNEDM